MCCKGEGKLIDVCVITIVLPISMLNISGVSDPDVLVLAISHGDANRSIMF